tara:strand:- start:59270 stop:59383 length:114 start_codon:yes stop_codon:yes gene_type:complete
MINSYKKNRILEIWNDYKNSDKSVSYTTVMEIPEIKV